MPYSVRMPDGTIIKNIPDSVPPYEARKRILQNYPQLVAEEKKPLVETPVEVPAVKQIQPKTKPKTKPIAEQIQPETKPIAEPEITSTKDMGLLPAGIDDVETVVARGVEPQKAKTFLDTYLDKIAPEVKPAVAPEVAPELEAEKGIFQTFTDLLKEPVPRTLIKGFPAAKILSGEEGVVSTGALTSQGVLDLAKALSDSRGAGNELSVALEKQSDRIAQYVSAISQNRLKDADEIMRAAEGRGALEELKAGVKAFAAAPAEITARAFGTAIPAVLAVAVASLASPIAAVGTAVGIGGTSGFGIVKGAIYDAVKDTLIKNKVPPEEAEKRATTAQEYFGKNSVSVFTGGGLGVLATLTGIEASFMGSILKNAVSKGVVRQIASGAAKESAPEFLQGAQEKIAQNLALQKEGFDVDTFKGAVGSGTLEGLAGAALGAGTGAALSATSVDPNKVREIGKDFEEITKRSIKDQRKQNKQNLKEYDLNQAKEELAAETGKDPSKISKEKINQRVKDNKELRMAVEGAPTIEETEELFFKPKYTTDSLNEAKQELNKTKTILNDPLAMQDVASVYGLGGETTRKRLNEKVVFIEDQIESLEEVLPDAVTPDAVKIARLLMEEDPSLTLSEAMKTAAISEPYLVTPDAVTPDAAPEQQREGSIIYEAVPLEPLQEVFKPVEKGRVGVKPADIKVFKKTFSRYISKIKAFQNPKFDTKLQDALIKDTMLGERSEAVGDQTGKEKAALKNQVLASYKKLNAEYKRVFGKDKPVQIQQADPEYASAYNAMRQLAKAYRAVIAPGKAEEGVISDTDQVRVEIQDSFPELVKEEIAPTGVAQLREELSKKDPTKFSRDRPRKITFDYDRQGSARITPRDVKVAKDIFQEELTEFNNQFNPRINLDDNIIKTSIASAKEDFYREDYDVSIEFETASIRASNNLAKKLKIAGANQELDNAVTNLVETIKNDYVMRLRNYDRLETPERVAGVNPFIEPKTGQPIKFSRGEKFLINTTPEEAGVTEQDLKDVTVGTPPGLKKDATQNFKDKPARISTATTAQLVGTKVAVNLLTVRQIGESLPRILIGDSKKPVQLTFIRNAVEIASEKLPGARTSIIKEAEKTIELLQDIVNIHGISELERLGTVMNEATMLEVDPSNERGRVADPALGKLYSKLMPRSKRAYDEIKVFFKKQMKGMIEDLKASARLNLDLKQDAEAIKLIDKKIDELFGEALKINPFFPLRRYGNYWVQDGENEDVDKKFYVFETNRQRERFIKEFEEKTGGSPTDSGTEFIKEATRGPGDPNFKFFEEVNKLIDSISIVPTDSKANVDDFKEHLKDSVLQLSFILMPNGNFRKMFINRKNIRGAEIDVLRSFANSSMNIAYQRARIKYTSEYNVNMDAARNQIVNLPASAQKDILTKIIANLDSPDRRAQILGLEPTSVGQSVANAITNLGFLTFLSAPASAALNIFGMTAIGIPTAAKRYGAAPVMENMTKYIGYYLTTPVYYDKIEAEDVDFIEYGDGKKTLSKKGVFTKLKIPDLGNSPLLTPLQKRAYDDLVFSGAIETSLTYDVAGLAERPASVSDSHYRKFAQGLAALFHHSEKMNRSVLALSVFDLAYEKAKKDNMSNAKAYEFALREAKEITYRALGDYVRGTKAPIFSTPLGKVLGQFKAYPLHVTYIMTRDSKTILGLTNDITVDAMREQLKSEGASNKDIALAVNSYRKDIRKFKKEAAYNLFGILGLTTVLGGLQAGFPFYSAMSLFVESLSNWEDEQDDDSIITTNIFGGERILDFDTAFQSFLTNTIGMGDRTAAAFIRGAPGEFLNVGLSDRVSLDIVKLWVRLGTTKRTAEDTLKSNVFANLGPAAGILVNSGRAVDFLRSGDWYNAILAVAPAIARGPMLALKYASEESVKTKSGKEILDLKNLDKMTLAQLYAIRALGFAPEKVLRQQAVMFKFFSEKAAIESELGLIQKEFNDAYYNRDGAAIAKTLYKYRKFIGRYPFAAKDLTEGAIKSVETLRKANEMKGLTSEKFYRALKPYIESIGKE